MTNKLIIEKAKAFLDGKDFDIDYIWNKKALDFDKVIAFEIDDRTDYIKVSSFLNMIEADNQKL